MNHGKKAFRSAVFALATLLVGGALPLSAQADTFSLNDALGITYETNPQLAAQRASLRATDEEVAKANAGWRPSINAQGTYGVEHREIQGVPEAFNDHPLNGEIIVNQPIFRGGRTYAEIGRAKALVRAGRAQLTNSEQQVLLAAVTAYMDVVRDTSIVELRRKNVEVLQKQLNATQLQMNAGDLTRTDVAQSQARLAGAQSDLTAAQGQLAVSRANFEQVIGRPAETLDVSPALPALPGTIDDAIALAGKQSPTLIAAKETERAADYAIDDTTGTLLPQLSLQGEYIYSRGALGTSSGFGGNQITTRTTAILAQLTVPIWQGGADHAAVRQSKELHNQAILNAENADRVVRDGASTAWNSFASAQSTIQSNEAQVKANQLAFEGVSKEQQVGGRTVLDVLNAQQELLNAEVS
ncbi:MAG: TolC family outer membrane protein, partial [Proteobacteria bacterium]|nr:TolC family outer membrane protein [Pseudomonadota bacterium]